MQKLNAVFPYLYLLFSCASASCQPSECPCLHEALSLLAEAHDMPQTSEDTRFGIKNLMDRWGLKRVETASSVVVWSTEPQPSRIGLDSRDTVLWGVGPLHAERKLVSDCSPSAALQLPSVSRPPAEPARDPQGLCTAEAIQETVSKAVQDAEENKNKRLKVSLERPNGRSSIKRYVKAHTVPYSGDFNKEMVKRKREREERQREMESRMVTNTMLFSSLLPSVEGSEEDYYL
ncbi:hypothetical protein ABBQ38_007058 [Trebouxia sp. C0009 RCD-2024]